MTNRVGPDSLTMYTAEALFGHEPRITYSPGITRETLDGAVDYVGHARATWTFAFLTVAQWNTARSTLFAPDANAYGGECYIETRNDDDDDIESDAIAIFPAPEKLDRWGGGYRDVSITFVLTDIGTPIPPGGGGGDYVTETELTAAIATHALDEDAHHGPQPANYVFAGPATGANAAPAFRAVVAADLPTATTAAQGAVELATTAETQAGSLSTRAVTPAGLRADIPATPAASRGVRLDASGYLNMPNGGRVIVDEVRARDSDGLKLYEDGGSGIFVEDSTGYVGIDTTDPDARLEVASGGSTATSYTARFQSSVGTAGAGGILFDQNSTNSFKVHTLGTGGADGALIFSYVTQSTGATLDGNILVLRSGGVGINTSGPDAKLDVNGALALQDMAAPSAVAGHSLFYSVSGEGYALDDSGNATQLTPHNFSLLGGPSEPMAWAYYSERDGKIVNVDMMRMARLVERLTGEKLVFIRGAA